MKVAIIGMGNVGTLRAGLVLATPGVQLVAVYDLNSSAVTGDFCRFLVGNISDVWRHEPDCVFICGFTDTLAAYTEEALKRGIHVFCEKPPARSLTELRAVRNSCSVDGPVLKYGFNHRYHYSVMEAKKVLESGELGSILWMRGVYGKAGSIDYHRNWRNFKEVSGGGILLDQGIHMLDLFQYFLGELPRVTAAHVSAMYWDIDCEDNAFLMLESEGQRVMTLHSSATHWHHKFLLEIFCEEGYVTLDGILSSTRSYAPEKLIIGRREFENETFALGKPQEQIIHFERDDSWRLEVKDFFDCVATGCQPKHGNISDAMNVLTMISQAYELGGFLKTSS